jgi:hypothetical protein
MRFSLQNWIVLGAGAAIVAACGGSVSLGDLGGTPAPGTNDGGGGTDSGGGGDDSGAAVDCASKADCGPMPASPAIKCSDGSIGGNTGRCIKSASGCAWEQRTCPPDACFDAQGTLDPSLRKCANASDCVVVDYPLDCCGSMRAAGVNIASQTKVEQCAKDRAASLPKCGCPTGPTSADDGSMDTTFSGNKPSVTCNPVGLCETSFKAGVTCGAVTCKPGQTCCSGVPFPSPTCFDSPACPVSQRKFKKDISYLTDADRERLKDELLGFPLATYRYKSESSADREHLGFIIDDVAPSPAVQQNGERVDMYGYQTMTVATLQQQARELAALRREIEELKATCKKR